MSDDNLLQDPNADSSTSSFKFSEDTDDTRSHECLTCLAYYYTVLKYVQGAGPRCEVLYLADYICKIPIPWLAICEVDVR